VVFNFSGRAVQAGASGNGGLANVSRAAR